MASKRKCGFCKNYFNKESMLTANNIIMFCCLDHMAKHGYQNKDKGAKIKHTAQKKALKDNDKSLRVKCAQQAFNAFIRTRDNGLGCVSCDKDKDWQGQWHAGHYKTTKARPDIRFNEDNCHKQCSICNNHLSGNIGEYTPKLIDRIGQDRFLALGLNKVRRYTCEELKEIELTYKRKLKELK
jgi:hypothetical protein